jgi:tetratricopeptide (TPR) repeat protein
MPDVRIDGRRITMMPTMVRTLVTFCVCLAASGAAFAQAKMQEAEREELRQAAREMQAAGQSAKAEAVLTRLLQIDPEDARSWLAFGRLMHSLGYYSNAAKACERALGLDLALESDVRACRALALAKRGDHAEAERMFKSIIDSAPDSMAPELYAGYTELLYETHRLQEALSTVDTFIQKFPKDGDAHYWRARIFFRAGQLKDAAEAGAQALKLLPDYAPLRQLMYRIYAKAGRKQEAAAQLAWLQRAETRTPSPAPGR